MAAALSYSVDRSPTLKRHHGSCGSNSSSNSERNDTSLNQQRDLPYRIGFTMTADRHVAQEPFGHGYKTKPMSRPKNWKSFSQVEYCLSQDMLGGSTFYDSTMSLDITAIIRTGYDMGAQLVVVNNDLVAKIYDPLCYAGINELDEKQDVFRSAYGDFSREATAYIEIQKSAAIALTPAFHGSWVVTVDTPILQDGEIKIHRRQIPLIILEYLRGNTMMETDPYSLSLELRSAILKQAIDAESMLWMEGISHRDFATRNIIVAGLDNSNPEDITAGVHIKIIDFNASIVRYHPKSDYHSTYETAKSLLITNGLSKLPSPIMRYHGSMSEFVDGWVGNGRYDADVWLWEQYHDDDRYMPVVWDPENPHIRPQYAYVVTQPKKDSEHTRNDSGTEGN